MKTLKKHLLFAFLITSAIVHANPIENLPKIMASIKSVHETNNEGKVNLSRLPKGKYKVLVRNEYLEKEKVVELI